MAIKKSKETNPSNSVYILPNDSAIEFPADKERLKLIDDSYNMTPMDYSMDLNEKSLTIRDRHSRIILNYYDDNILNKKGVDLVPRTVSDFLEEMCSEPLKIIDFLSEKIQYQSLEIDNTSRKMYKLHERTTKDIQRVLSREKGATLDKLLGDEKMIDKISTRLGKEEGEQLIKYVRTRDEKAVKKLLNLVETEENQYKEKYKYLVDSKNILDNARRSILEASLIEISETDRIKSLLELVKELDTENI